MKHCDFCHSLWGQTKPAHVDGALNFKGREITGGRGWANMCKLHFRAYGVGLGIGKGQEIQNSTLDLPV
jgi:hypothetical protein